jgi:hypothetical protein
VRTECATPPPGGITGFVAKEVVRPLGAPETVKSTGSENTPTDCTVTVEVADPPGVIDSDSGEVEIAKSLVPASICTDKSALRVIEPPVPITRNVKVPVEPVELV